ncbi:MAG TPA: hypothetical protein VFP33_02020 [Gallionella sp.]|nr:hypothetical protein [Gallionella sp.]
MKKLNLGLIGAGMVLMPAMAQAFVSGSTGADGAFSPTVNTQVVLPPSGILNYTTVNIPAGVTVTFKKNATNTPVVILASGNVTVAGTIWLGGGNATATGAAGDGALGDDGIPGTGGPGGYDGGRGGMGTLTAPAWTVGGVGLGPGGGKGGVYYPGVCFCGGGGGGFGIAGANNRAGTNWAVASTGGAGGAAYGSSQLLPLIGGSGGGGGVGNVYNGGGGGGGGGAILIASSGTVNVSGTIGADGGLGGAASGANLGGSGGGGAGGAIRIVATTISGNGTLVARGNAEGANDNYWWSGGTGGSGRIRLEAETFTRTAASTPGHTQGLPGPVFVAGLPTLSIASVGGVAVPAQPTGNADVTLPATTPNPVTVSFATTGVPAGNTVRLTLTPANGAETTVVSPALVGDTTSATASVNITLPNGPSTLMATVTYNIVLAMGDALSVYAQGERVEKITLATALGSKESTVTLITVSGKEYVVPAGVLAAMPV